MRPRRRTTWQLRSRFFNVFNELATFINLTFGYQQSPGLGSGADPTKPLPACQPRALNGSFRLFSRCREFGLPDQSSHALGRQRQFVDLDPERPKRVFDGMGDRHRRPHAPTFAAAFDAELGER